MGRRSVLVAVALWLGVVVVVSGATWTVIDAAGRDVTTRPASDPAAAGVPASTTSNGATSPTRRATRTPRPRHPRSPAPSRPATTAPAATVGPATSTPPPAPSPAAGATTRAPAPRPSTRAPDPVERTWAGSVGSVTARCTGSRIALAAATPADGWRMQVDERGPGRIEVEFRSATSDRAEDESEDHGDSVDVRAECAGGVPRFRVDT